LKSLNNIQISIEKELVLSVLRARLGTSSITTNSRKDDVWSSAFQYSINQRVVLLLYDYFKLERIDLPENFLERMSKLYRSNSIHNYRYLAELIAITRCFSDNLIHCIHLKGISLSEYLYHDSGLRPIVDLDILVQTTDFFKANELLVKRGYTRMLQADTIRGKIHKRMTHNWPFRHEAKRIIVELHRKYLSKSRANRIGTEGIWSRPQTMLLDGQSIQILSPEDLLVYLCIHASKEFWGSLLQVNDIASLIVQHPELDWSVVIGIARSRTVSVKYRQIKNF